MLSALGSKECESYSKYSIFILRKIINRVELLTLIDRSKQNQIDF